MRAQRLPYNHMFRPLWPTLPVTSTTAVVNRRPVATTSTVTELVDDCHHNKKSRVLSHLSMSCWHLKAYQRPFAESALTLATSCRRPVIQRPTEVLVRVMAASVNPLDVWMTAGYGRSLLDAAREVTDWPLGYRLTHDRLPLVLGRDFCGQIVASGQRVKRYKPGHVVWGALPPHWPAGSHAQYVVADESHISLKPSNISPIEAASVPFAGLTAWAAVRTFGQLNERNSQNKRALVLGGSGGVGSIAIQLLKTWGAHVTTTCSLDAMDFVYSNTGADQCIDYKDTNQFIATSDDGFDLVLNAAGVGIGPEDGHQNTYNWTQYLSPDGKYVTLTTPLLVNTDRYGVVLGTSLSVVDFIRHNINSKAMNDRSVRWAYYMPDSSALESISRLVTQSSIKPVIDQTFSFNDLPLAYRRVADGHARGKTVIDFTL